MSQNQLVQARINGEIKAKATMALAAVGLTVSDAVRILLNPCGAGQNDAA